MSANINISRTPSRYPAPVSFYGPGWYYRPEWVEHAERLHEYGRARLQQARSASKKASPVSVPSKSHKNHTCEDCGEFYVTRFNKPDSRYCALCSRKYRANGVRVTCRICDQPFTPPAPNSTVCRDTTCRKEHERRRKAELRAKERAA